MMEQQWAAGMAAGMALALMVGPARAGREMERIDRGLVAVRGDGGVFVGWRWLAGDPEGVGFNLYRVDGGKVERVNPAPLREATSILDPVGGEEYFVRPVDGAVESGASERVKVLARPYLEIPIRPIDGYRPGDCSVGDLDGDGSWEIVVHQVGRARDNGSAGMTSPPVLDAYKLDGTLLWRIDLGKNIREGEHYTQFMVYDLDGDGRAELACKTADGSTDGTGAVIGDADKDWRNMDEGSQRFGRILSGPEYFTIFDGVTGAALATADYIPGRSPIDGWGGIGGNGRNDSYGNRCDRFLACVAYLDGRRPSVVMCRGVYGRTVLAAWDWRDGKLASRWVFDSGSSYPPFKDASPFSGMGGHGIAVTDVDGDGRDEIVYQAMVVDDDGRGLFSTGRRHGDVLHVGDFDPERAGKELYLVTENEDQTVAFGTPGAGMHDARTGKMLWSHSPGVDISHGVVADIDPRHPGAEVWGGPGGLRTVRGQEIGAAPRVSEWVLWWDGDLLRELYGGGSILKWDWKEGREERIFTADLRSPGPDGASGRRYSGPRRPNLTADLLGDWREELLLASPDGKSLRLYTTTIPTSHRLICLMQDPQYRLAVTRQNVVYNKPPHVSYYLGHGMR